MTVVLKDPAVRTEAEKEMLGTTDMAAVCPELATLGARSQHVVSGLIFKKH